MAKHPCPAACQSASDAFMELREKCDEVEVAALNALSAMRAGKIAMMAIEPIVMSAETGEGEELLYQLAATPGLARHMHYFFSQFMRHGNFELPNPPTYDENNQPEFLSVRIKTPRRR